jgi:hypothetical protein
MNAIEQTRELSTPRVRRLASGFVLGAGATFATLWLLSRR